MQEASGPPYQAAILGMKPLRGQSPRCKTSFKFWGAASHFSLLVPAPFFLLNPGAKPYDQFALLLFALPLVFTLQKFVELLAFTERSHQLQAAPSGFALIGLYPFAASSFFRNPAHRFLSLFKTPRIFWSASFPTVVHVWKARL